MTRPAEEVLRYLRSVSGDGRGAKAETESRYPFVTVSRQAGAGGRSLAQALASAAAAVKQPEFQGWKVFDDELCRRITEDPELVVPLKDLLNEEYRTALEDYLLRVIAAESSQALVYRKMFETIRTIAALGKAVIVGRGASTVTRDLPLGVHIRLVASRKTRVERMASRLGLDSAHASRWVDEHDAGRARLVKDFFKRDINDPLLYDLVCNTDTMSLSQIASAAVRLAESRLDAYRAREHSA
jgi:cytidylate kinase